MGYPLHLKARRRGREQWIRELKRKTLEMNKIHQMRYPSMTNLLRVRQAPLTTLQHPLQQPLHFKPHIHQSPHPQPLHRWLRVQALLDAAPEPGYAMLAPGVASVSGL